MPTLGVRRMIREKGRISDEHRADRLTLPERLELRADHVILANGPLCMTGAFQR
jgi:hypothetical protein